MTSNLPSKGRLEAYSDGVFSIVATLLVLEIRVPELQGTSVDEVLRALAPLSPKFLSFAASFFTLAVFWVNHQTFVHMLRGSNAKLLWLNMLMLFWLTTIPFTTALLGEHPDVPLVVALYAISVGLAGASFSLMGYYTFFRSNLVSHLPLDARQKEWRRSLFGVGLYVSAACIAVASARLALCMVLLAPLFFIAPRLIVGGSETGHQ